MMKVQYIEVTKESSSPSERRETFSLLLMTCLKIHRLSLSLSLSVQSPATASMHNLPRFGYPNNFAYLFGTQQQQSEYIFGLLFAGCFILAFFFVWIILLAVFKCLGPRKIGFLSGNPMKVSYGSKKPLIIRITFILAAITLVAFATTLVTQGLTQLRNGVGTLHASSVVRVMICVLAWR